MWRALWNHHPRFLLGLILQRLIPKSWFRLRKFSLFELKSSGSFGCPDDINDDSIEIRPVTDAKERETLIRITQVNPDDIHEETVSLALFQNEEIVGGLHLQPTRFLERELGLWIELPIDGFWLFSSAIGKPFRRRGLYRRLLGFLRTDERWKNRRIYLAIDRWNLPSLSAHENFVEEVGRWNIVRIWRGARMSGTGRATVRNGRSTNLTSDPLSIRIAEES